MIPLYIFGSILLVSALSLIGIVFLLRDAWVRKFLFYFISFAAGGLIREVFIHLLPEMVEQTEGSFLPASLLIAAGIFASFVLEKIIHWHHCHHVEEGTHTHAHAVGTMMLVGDAAHNITDGILIAGSYL